MKLLFDEMLKNLASWCRILGIDSEFFSGRSDSYLLDYAEKHNLIFATRDIQLSLRCAKRGVRYIMIRSDRIEEQIAQVIQESGAEVSFPEKTRCARCNGELETTGKESIKGEVPQNVFEVHERFWRCRSCKRIYWEGGHWKNIRRIYSKVEPLLKAHS